MKRRRLILLGILILVSITAISPARQVFIQRQRIETEQAKLAALRHENEKLEQRLERLKNPDYLEKVARDELGMVAPGEVSYVVVPSGVAEEELPPPPPKPWYERAWNHVLSLFD